jgi:hypothetical protein
MMSVVETCETNKGERLRCFRSALVNADARQRRAVVHTAMNKLESVEQLLKHVGTDLIDDAAVAELIAGIRNQLGGAL